MDKHMGISFSWIGVIEVISKKGFGFKFKASPNFKTQAYCSILRSWSKRPTQKLGQRTFLRRLLHIDHGLSCNRPRIQGSSHPDYIGKAPGKARVNFCLEWNLFLTSHFLTAKSMVKDSVCLSDNKEKICFCFPGFLAKNIEPISK